MTDHGSDTVEGHTVEGHTVERHTVERHCDVAVVGGSVAGLAAALQLVRQRRSVIVVDSGEPRNAPSAHLHSYLSRDGVAPSALTDSGREEVRSYGGEVLAGEVQLVTRCFEDRFRLELTGGHSIVARRVLAATGLVDVLPDIGGLAERWGREVVHCPFCHGFEIRDRRVVAVVDAEAGLHTASLFRQLTSRLVVVQNRDVNDRALDVFRAGGVDVRRSDVRRIVAGSDGRMAAVELADGRLLEADAVAVTPRFAARIEPFLPLGLQHSEHPSGLGDFVECDATGQTAVAGLYAAGNVTDPSQQALQAAANGSRVGAMIAFSLADEDLRAASRSSANEADWDHRYGG
jgi:thioredoxin reductase